MALALVLNVVNDSSIATSPRSVNNVAILSVVISFARMQSREVAAKLFININKYININIYICLYLLYVYIYLLSTSLC